MNKEQKQFLLSSLFSGIMIGIGCTVYLSCVNKLVGALLFCAGLFFILTNGGTLFTGICGLKTPVKKLAWVFVLNVRGSTRRVYSAIRTPSVLVSLSTISAIRSSSPFVHSTLS